jgi:hypothetical protein
MGETRIKWGQIIVATILTGVVAVITGMTLFYFQTREPKLTYSLSDTIPFKGYKETLAIYNVVIRNEGKKVVENVDCHIEVTGATIKDHRVTGASALNYKESLGKGEYKVHFADLNPRESVILSILISSLLGDVDRPQITLRGKGTLGKEARDEKTERRSFLNNPIFAATLSAYAALAAVLGFLITTRRRRFLSFKIGGHVFDSDVHRDDQNEIIAYLFSIHGRPDMAESYLKRNRVPSYWSEADYIAAVAIKETDPETKEMLKQILIDLSIYAGIAEGSQGIIHYNIARIAKHQGKEQECDEHLELAKKKIPKLLKKRLSLDPVFKASNRS